MAVTVKGIKDALSPQKTAASSSDGIAMQDGPNLANVGWIQVDDLFGAIQGRDGIKFTETPNGTNFTPGDKGLLTWDPVNDILLLGVGNGNSIPLGRGLEIRGKNIETTTIAKGSVVYVSGSDGTNSTIKLADASDDSTLGILCVTAEEITSNSIGRVILYGRLSGVNTTSWTPGTQLYLSTTPGIVTSTAPASPNNKVIIGIVIKQDTTEGIILVGVKSFEKLKNLSDVTLTDPIPDKSVLRYDLASGLWKDDALTDKANLSLVETMQGLGWIDETIKGNADDIQTLNDEKGVANGIATLDAAGKIPSTQLPVSAMEYKGNWDASTGVYPATPDTGDYWIVSVAGAVSGEDYDVGDAIIYDGSGWNHLNKIEIAEEVSLTSDLYTATDVKSALEEIAGSGRTTETVKGNADAIDAQASRIDSTNISLIQTKSDVNLLEKALQQGQGATLDFTGISIVPLDARATGRANPTVEGLTATNEVENGDFSDGTTGWVMYNTTGSLLIAGDYIKSSLTALAAAIGQTIVTVPENKYFIACIAKMESSAISDANFLQAKNAVGAEESEDISIGTTDTYCSTIMTGVVDRNFIGLGRSTTVQDIYIKKNSFVVLNLTSIFGAGNEPSEADCAKIFSYFDGTKSIQLPARVRSIGRNSWPLDVVTYDGEYYASASGAILPNSSRTRFSLVRVAPNTQYTLKAYNTTATNMEVTAWDRNGNYITYLALGVSTEKTFTTTDATFYIGVTFSSDAGNLDGSGIYFMLNLGSTALPYEPYTSDELYIADSTELRKVPAIADEIKVVNGELVKVQMVQSFAVSDAVFGDGLRESTLTKYFQYSTIGLTSSNSIPSTRIFSSILPVVSADDTYVISDNEGYSLNSAGVINIRILKTRLTNSGFTADVEGFNNWLKTLNFESFMYQLASPITTKLTTSGTLSAKKGGTVYLEHVIADAGKYTTEGTITKTAHPISSIEALYKIELDGSLTEITDAVVAGDGLSFTSASLSTDDLWHLIYSYDEPLSPEMTVNVLNNMIVPTTVSASTYTVLEGDHTILVSYTATGACTITIPSDLISDYVKLIIKDSGGNASVNNITIATEGAETIDGSASYTINTDNGKVQLVSDGSNLYVL
jgi:hypothetical protein